MTIAVRVRLRGTDDRIHSTDASIMVMTINSKTLSHALSGLPCRPLFGSLLLATVLAGCGGGGSDPGTAGVVQDGAQQVASSTDGTRQIFIDGIYQLSGTRVFINGVDQAEIRKISIPATTLPGVDVKPTVSRYAGMLPQYVGIQTAYRGFDFGLSHFRTLSADGWINGFAAEGYDNLLNFGPDDEAILSSPALTGANGVMLGITATTERAAGQSIKDYIDAAFPDTIPVDGTGVFTGDAKLVSFSYRTLTDFILRIERASSSDFESLDDFSKAGKHCYSNSDLGTSALVQFNGDGSFSLYDTSNQVAWCTQVILDASIPKLGSGTYEQKSFAGVKYLELTFPPDFDLPRYDINTRAEDIAAGVKQLVVEKIDHYGISRAQYVPQGITYPLYEKFLNKEAADQIKAALKLQ
ncbi:MAG: hypothetical protein ACO1N5_07235 [Noviherbaspirillum sp.]